MAGKSDFGIPDEENPEISAEDFARSRPFKEVFPEQYSAWRKKMGRPPVEKPKVQISFRLAADLVDSIRATGRGYNTRVEHVLRDALARGELSEVEVTERVLTRFRGREDPAVSLDDVTLEILRVHHRTGATRKEILDHLSRAYERPVRPDELGNMLQRQRRARRLEHREGRWFIAPSRGPD